MSIRDKLQENNRPHKLLALDGGGMRGVITIEILAEIERLLQHAVLIRYHRFSHGLILQSLRWAYRN